MGKPIAPHLVASAATVADALEAINRSDPKIAVVIDDDGKLLRTVTDGDVRRGILGEVTLESNVTDLPGRRPIALKAPVTLDSLRDTMNTAKVAAVVIVDQLGCPCAIADRSTTGEAILMSPPHMGSRELDFVHEAFEDNWIAPAGPNLTRFEAQLKEVSACNEALAVVSGTAALHLALRVIGVERGARVYVSNLTFVASLQPILYEGAVPVLIDSEPVSWNMSPAALAAQLARDDAAGSLPRAIVVVHLYGQSADLDPILDLAARYNIPLIEDAAESLGASYRGRPSGNHGLLSAYSFNGNKIITTSGGGALVGNDEELLARARHLATQGREPAEHYQHATIAYNYRMSNVLAGIGSGQLELLTDRVAARRAIFNRYCDGLGDLAGIGFQGEVDGSAGSRWLTVITLDPDQIPVHCYQVIRGLKAAGIEARPGWKPMTMQPLCQGLDYAPHSETDDVSSRLFLQCICLPSGSALDENAQGRVIERVRKLVRGD